MLTEAFAPGDNNIETLDTRVCLCVCVCACKLACVFVYDDFSSFEFMTGFGN